MERRKFGLRYHWSPAPGQPPLQKFWKKAVEQLGPDLAVYYIQHGVPMEHRITELETLYFIKKDSALKMLHGFYEILLPELDD